MNTLTLRQKWRTRNSSLWDSLRSVRLDSRLAIYKLLPIVTNPKARKAMGRTWASFKPRTPDFQLDVDIREQLVNFEKDGVLTGMPSIDDRRLKELLSYFQSQPCHDPWRPHLGLFPWNQTPSQDCNMGMYSAEQIVRAPYVMEMFNHPRLLALAEAYLGCKPTLDNMGCWWSYSDRVIAKGTQQFHRDFDSLGGFKVFFYLTDVTTEHGPHEYVRGSHACQSLDTGAGIPDELLWQHYDASKALVITGKAGTSFIADTFGIHRGQLPSKGFRLLLSAQYNLTVSPHGPRTPFQFMSSTSLDPFINRLYVRRSE